MCGINNSGEPPPHGLGLCGQVNSPEKESLMLLNLTPEVETERKMDDIWNLGVSLGPCSLNTAARK
jgi:hypothetical protein